MVQSLLSTHQHGHADTQGAPRLLAGGPYETQGTARKTRPWLRRKSTQLPVPPWFFHANKRGHRWVRRDVCSSLARHVPRPWKATGTVYGTLTQPSESTVPKKASKAQTPENLSNYSGAAARRTQYVLASQEHPRTHTDGSWTRKAPLSSDVRQDGKRDIQRQRPEE